MAVAHTHSAMIVTLSIAGIPLRTVENQGACVIGNRVPVYEKYGLVNSSELGNEVADTLGSHHGIRGPLSDGKHRPVDSPPGGLQPRVADQVGTTLTLDFQLYNQIWGRQISAAVLRPLDQAEISLIEVLRHTQVFYFFWSRKTIKIKVIDVIPRKLVRFN